MRQPPIVRSRIEIVVGIIAVAMSLFQLYTGYFGVLPVLKQRAIHLGFALVLIFLSKPLQEWKRKSHIIIDSFLASLSVAGTIYILISHDRLISRMTYLDPVTVGDKFFGIATLFLVIYATARAFGWVMSAIAIGGIVYWFAGPVIPDVLGHPGLSFEFFIEQMYIRPMGIYGIPLGISATFIFLFILFGAFLKETGLGNIIIQVAIGIFGGQRGGPAKASVISSMLMGTISGSAVANVYATGSFTIPLMKQYGYRYEFAGGVEAAASTGGQIMPPLMGAAAFILADFVGISYWHVAVAAFIPAVLYFFTIYVAIDAESRKTGLRGLPRNELPDVKSILRKYYFILTPLAVVIYLLASGYSPNLAAFGAIIATVAASFIRKETRLDIRKTASALKTGALNATPIALALATAGIIVSIVMTSGLGIKVTEVVLLVARNHLVPALVLVMVSTLILGMGLPTSGAYIIASALTAPALVKMGTPLLNAHMFIFYYSCVSAITPPVALASYAAASVANGHLWKTAMDALRLGVFAFIVPFIFVYGARGSLLLLQGSPAYIMIAIVTAFAGCALLVYGLNGFMLTRCSWYERIFAIIAGLCLVAPGMLSNLFGLLLGVIVAIINRADKFYVEVKPLSHYTEKNIESDPKEYDGQRKMS